MQGMGDSCNCLSIRVRLGAGWLIKQVDHIYIYIYRSLFKRGKFHLRNLEPLCILPMPPKPIQKPTDRLQIVSTPSEYR